MTTITACRWLLVLLLAALSVPAIAQQSEILETIDDQVSFLDSDFSAEYTITQSKPGQGNSTTRAAVFRRDARDTYTIIILEPERDQGKGYLKIGNRTFKCWQRWGHGSENVVEAIWSRMETVPDDPPHVHDIASGFEPQF